MSLLQLPATLDRYGGCGRRHITAVTKYILVNVQNWQEIKLEIFCFFSIKFKAAEIVSRHLPFVKCRLFEALTRTHFGSCIMHSDIKVKR
jgi:hypothetical protein